MTIWRTQCILLADEYDSDKSFGIAIDELYFAFKEEEITRTCRESMRTELSDKTKLCATPLIKKLIMYCLLNKTNSVLYAEKGDEVVLLFINVNDNYEINHFVGPKGSHCSAPIRESAYDIYRENESLDLKLETNM